MMTAKAAARGEPWKSYFDPAGLEEMLGQIGFGAVESFSAPQLNQRYLSGRQDNLKVGGVARLMRTRVA